ncbi:putative protein YggR [Vibrio stylophorae]|uniref:Bacterial type II secretion system protein E domain-containing protein n=1 Tax=Vibrio stylophorae TaxID=659351 RepID=A0ABM8ZQM1_9VIBR|nr:PilT/PilU family type 4a pilus ATPase [Vibrio stylophorae]CAH0532599.1 putative protein YggR [Vibrio stylophorae]
MQLDVVLDEMITQEASDLYVTVDASCVLRVNGRLKPFGEKLDISGVNRLIKESMDKNRLTEFVKTKEANFAIARGNGRFRVSAFWQRECPGMVIRRIQTQIPTMEELELPEVMKDIALAKRGLVLVVGATGSGKSTSMAAMVGYRNKNRADHILSIEDPIEFVHQHDKSIITQREVGLDTESFDTALKNSLRQAPNMILIGEIRNRETMEYAMTFSETGHLCMATLHANNANQAMERILHLVPEDRQSQFLFDLSLNLRAVIAQQLVPSIDGSRRFAAFEILINTPRVSDVLQKGELHELKGIMGKSREAGMITFDQALYELYRNERISYTEALHHADSANELRLMIKLDGQDSEANVNKLDGVKLDYV